MGLKRLSPDQGHLPQTEKLYNQGESMEPDLHHTYLTYAVSLTGGRLFFKPRMCHFGKIEICSKSCFS